MAEFMMLIAQDESEAPKVPPEQFEKVFTWWRGHEEAGRLKAGLGRRLQPSSTARTVAVKGAGGGSTVTDGPFIEAKEMIGGYGIIEASSIEDAVQIASGWPAGPAWIEVRPVLEM
ncbi:MAG TPA: YciI family protein [Dehalococcoidia bacterium]|nr:YciI family protein [Dehalococcoidia bacterium]